jgi:DNA-binding HxlR family transcriptional regulator
MQKKDLGSTKCPISRSLDKVGEWWSIMILRDCFYGETRFDGFQKSLGIAPNMLARRLNELVEAGLLERRQYSAKPPRDEYLLTECGRDFRPVLLMLGAWGNKYFAPEGKAVQLRDDLTGEPVQLALVDQVTGAPIDLRRHGMAANELASEATQKRLRIAAERRAAERAAASPQ